jgi:uncharacterized repeat protein (TIGR01451 family)
MNTYTRRRVATVPLVIMALVAWLAVAAGERATAAHSVPVTVTITSVDGVGDDLDGIGRSDGDFYAGVEFAGGAMQPGPSFATHVDDDPNITPYWPISSTVQVVDDSSPAASVTISIWDHDDCSTAFCDDTGVFESNDDQLDIRPGAGETVTLTVNLATGRWTGPVNWPTNCVTGDGGEAVKVCFDISIDSASGDADGDFLLDGWERNGFNPNGDSTVDVNLPAMGAGPQRKDLFVEIDCLVDTAAATAHTHCPVQGAVQTVVQSFADAPVNNVDGSTGIQLHVDIGNLYGQGAGVATSVPRAGAPAGGVAGTFGNYGGGGSQIAEAGNLVIDWDGATGRAGTNFFTLKTANFDSQRDLIFRYGIFGHQTNNRSAANDCTSGWAKGIPSVNFFVTLGGTRANGNPCWGTDAAGFSVGSQNQQAGTLMHEFGHTLGLGHGGVDGFNNKPNYLSVMNYGISTGPATTPNNVQMCGVPAVGGLPGGCDFSRNALPALNEVNPPGLDECAGIGLGLGGFDWSGAGGLTGTSCAAPNTANVQANINGDFNDADNDGTQDPGEAPTFSNLPGFEDWNSIFYGFRTIANFQTAGTPVDDEPDPDAIIAARASTAELVRPVLSVDKTGPSDASPGDTLDYTIKTGNTGRGPALVTKLTDTLPDATQTSFDLGTLRVGAEDTRATSFLVPCTTTDGTVLTNSAKATGTDLIGNPVSGTDSVTTTVHAPVLTLSKSASSSSNAGEAITYRITYDNTGSGAAANVTITDKVPTDVYYSKALDQGAGPRPDTVTPNADGTTTLTWNVGTLGGNSGPKIIEYTARPSLLLPGGSRVENGATITFTNTNGCAYTPVTAARTTTITEVMPSRDPLSQGFWKTHPEFWTAELLARIQATDQRFDGADGSTPDGRLSIAEATATFNASGTQARSLRSQLLATYLNLASRRTNASTNIVSRTATENGVNTVREAGLFSIATLALPLNSTTAGRYSDAIRILDEINTNKSEVY